MELLLFFATMGGGDEIRVELFYSSSSATKFPILFVQNDKAFACVNVCGGVDRHIPFRGSWASRRFERVK